MIIEGLKNSYCEGVQTDTKRKRLVAEFCNRSVNPQDWNSKCKFREGIITSWLRRSLLCLSTVVEEFYKKGEITSKHGNAPNTSWTSWAINTMVKKPVVWSFTKMKDILFITTKNNNITRNKIHSFLNTSRNCPIIQSNIEKHDLLLKVLLTRVDNLTEGDESLFKLKERERQKNFKYSSVLFVH
ncbi:uncharacterized protein LOC122856369 [Aphidius gifuensis]|uniref:uncharacterized protein LOC122856369 n=1 Tax=Aphidius gifuensis TaxID=684658 RepID=UPI001CDC6EBA|nr:uncharacterized protein LOC122856369 [Aphidius gifuensis]